MRALRSLAPHAQGILGALAVAVGTFLLAGAGPALIVTGALLLLAQFAEAR